MHQSHYQRQWKWVLAGKKKKKKHETLWAVSSSQSEVKLHHVTWGAGFNTQHFLFCHSQAQTVPTEWNWTKLGGKKREDATLVEWRTSCSSRGSYVCGRKRPLMMSARNRKCAPLRLKSDGEPWHRVAAAGVWSGDLYACAVYQYIYTPEDQLLYTSGVFVNVQKCWVWYELRTLKTAVICN